MQALIETPTYWRKGKKVPVFDHPIPLNTNGWLNRYLKNITNHPEFDLIKNLVLFPAPSTIEVEKKVKRLSKGFGKVEVFSLETLKMIRNVLKKHNFSKEFLKTIHSNSYSCVRNMGLVKGALEKADLLILLDDDEILLDKEFITKALEINSFDGKTGYYTSKGKHYLHALKPPNWALKWQKTELIAETTQKCIGLNKRFTKTNIALGGCMVITKRLYQNVCFDPYIPRGEDLDFLINSKHCNYNFIFDKELSVEHLPPQGKKYFWQKFRGDIHRFIYQRQKIRDLGIPAKDLSPYPGDFLKEDLEERIMYTAKNFVKEVLKKKNDKLVTNTKIEIEKAQKYAKNNSKKYLNYLSEWKKMMILLDNI